MNDSVRADRLVETLGAGRLSMRRRHMLSLVGMAGVAALPKIGVSAPNAPFDFFNRRIPDELHALMGRVAHQGITTLAFTPSGGWVLVTQDGDLFSRDIPQECEQKLRQWLGLGYRINCVAFPPAGGNSWAIVADRDIYARNIPDECWQRMRSFWDAGKTMVHLSFPPSGGNSWFILTDSDFYSRNCGSELYEQVKRYLSEGRKLLQVAFPWHGGWVVTAADGFVASGVTSDCDEKMRELTGKGWQLNNVAFVAGGDGWSLYCRARLAPRPTPDPMSPSTEDRASGKAAAVPKEQPSEGTLPTVDAGKESWMSPEGLTAAATLLGAVAALVGTVGSIWLARRSRRRGESQAADS
ncbi:hypothetical protein ACIBTV_29490 [Micromonospora sp. NPDC049366]|uniref:hypothetical protein n=1 Tax=Micromonospora sp. NPDC049366 TaxID=3364271 RepID=UPI00378BBD1E